MKVYGLFVFLNMLFLQLHSYQTLPQPCEPTIEVIGNGISVIPVSREIDQRINIRVIGAETLEQIIAARVLYEFRHNVVVNEIVFDEIPLIDRFVLVQSS